MKHMKKALSLLLVVVMILGTVVLGSAGSANTNYEHNKVGDLTGGAITFAGQTAVVNYNSIAKDAEVDVQFDLFIDPATYSGFASGSFQFSYDSKI